MSVKEKILDTASELFYKRGVNSTGIDLIIAEAGIAKASLYNNFASKEDLVAKYLERIRLTFESRLSAAIDARGMSLTIPFDLLEDSVIEGEFFGCPFTNALTELPSSKLVRAEVSKYRKAVENYFSEVAPESVVPQLMLVYDGAFTGCKLEPSKSQVVIASKLAQQLVAFATIKS
jgi:AcrR family transcriptional regulator